MDEREELNAVVEASWNALISIWRTHGHNEESIRNRKQTVVKHVKVLFDEMVTEEERKSAEKRETIRLLVIEIVQLSTDLSIEANVDSYSESNNNGKTLLAQVAELTKQVESLRAQKKIRMAKYDYLRDQEKVLIEEMQEPAAVIEFSGIPNDDQVAELEGVVSYWNKEKLRRQRVLEELQASIGPLFNQLERSPSNSIERLVVCPTTPSLTTKNIEDFQKLLTSLQAQIKANEEETAMLWTRITELWKRLKTCDEYRGSFEKAMSGCKPSIIKGLRTELARCEEEKRKNLQSFIVELRHELVELWQQCFLSEDQKHEFQEFESQDYTEECLEAHENEVTKWKTYCATYSKMIDAIRHRAETWMKWLELEEIEDDPARLSNRGGALLKHEREKKATKKALDKCESDIRKLDTLHVQEHGRHFLVYGRPVLEAIEEEKAQAADERLERKNARKRQHEEAKAGATPGAASRKRPLPQTPGKTVNYTPAKRGKPTTATRNAAGSTFISRPSPYAQSKQAGATKRTPAADQTRMVTRHIENKKTPALGSDDVDIISPASTYSEFTNHLMKSSTMTLSSSVCQPFSQNGQNKSHINKASHSAARKGTQIKQMRLRMTPASSQTQLQNQF